MSDEEIPVKIDRRLAVLAPKFLADCRRMPGEVRGAIESGNIATRAASATRLGHRKQLRFRRDRLAREEIERAARAGDIEALRKLSEQLDSYLARVRPVFD